MSNRSENRTTIFLDFEKEIAELEGKIEELRHFSSEDGVSVAEEVGTLEGKVDRQLRAVYGKLQPWQKVQVARHPARPHFKDAVAALIEDFTPLAGDRGFAEDKAVVGGLGRFRGYTVMVIGTEKGGSTQERLDSNFGMARPEGYRKAQRLMRMAEHFGLPIFTLIDTAGAYPGLGAEERGQAEAIARSIETSLDLATPVIATVIGEGGSGGAVALATADRVLMFEHAIYSVISPEGCASILWRDGAHARDAAEALKITAQDLAKLKVIDRIVEEPLGAAHRDPEMALKTLGDALAMALEETLALDVATLRTRRREKFLAMSAEPRA